MNEYQEKALFQRFKDSYKDFPDTQREKVCGQDQPDSVILTTENKKIGIELTEMFQDNINTVSDGSDLLELEKVHETIGNSIVKEAENDTSKKFQLDITFNKHATFSQKRKHKIISKISSLIKKYLPTLESKETFTFTDFYELRDSINDFCICTNPNFDKSYFANSPSGGIIDLTNKHIETVLEDKNKDIEGYEKCDEYWLVIKMGRSLAGSFAENKIDESFKTKFDKIFLHNIQTSKTVEIEVQKYS